MNAMHANVDPAVHGHGDAYSHGSRRSYLIGFSLSVLFTAIPFWLVMSSALQNPQTVALLIFAFAFAQIIVHAIYFLHLDTRSESGWTLMASVFTVVIVAITIAGSIWIMYHLDLNMMPMAPGSPGGAM